MSEYFNINNDSHNKKYAPLQKEQGKYISRDDVNENNESIKQNELETKVGAVFCTAPGPGLSKRTLQSL